MSYIYRQVTLLLFSYDNKSLIIFVTGRGEDVIQSLEYLGTASSVTAVILTATASVAMVTLISWLLIY